LTTFLSLHGWQGSEPGHRQRPSAAELEGRGHTVRLPDFPDPDAPRFGPWLARLEQELRAIDRPTVCFGDDPTGRTAMRARWPRPALRSYRIAGGVHLDLASG
jgi:serine hydrolase